MSRTGLAELFRAPQPGGSLCLPLPRGAGAAEVLVGRLQLSLLSPCSSHSLAGPHGQGQRGCCHLSLPQCLPWAGGTCQPPCLTRGLRTFLL